MTKDEALKLALEALLHVYHEDEAHPKTLQAINAIKEALAQTEQEPVAYDKTEMNCFAQDLYDKKMKEGKHGHYETMFHVVHQAIKRVQPQRERQQRTYTLRKWQGLTDEEIWESDSYKVAITDQETRWLYRFAKEIEAKLKEKNT